MFYLKRNLPLWERILRTAGALALAALAAMAWTGNSSTGFWLLITGTATLALTGIIGFCPACAMFGRQSPKESK
ncbi:DUF2892 domain-containing protein [Delftia acidovorans]|uniref:YgaP family membrane protein n=1 Tax=Delftia acidovorans TaxID=80866 RepID=UPI003019E338